MPFLGKQPTAGFASIVKDDLTPNGSTTAFTLSKQVANANDIAVFLGNVRQEPTDAYTVSGTTLTMSEAPASGLNFYVLHIAGTVESSVVPADGTITNAKIVGMAASKLTGALPAISGAALTGIAQDYVLLSTQSSPSNAAQITLTLDSTGTYSEQILVLAGWFNMNPVDTYLRTVEGGSVISGSSDYQYIAGAYNAGQNPGVIAQNSHTHIRTNWYSTGDSANETNDLIIRVRHAESSTQRTMITGTHNGLAGNASMSYNEFVGRRSSAAVATAIQVTSSNASSNYMFSNGAYIKHYGVK